MMSLKAYFQGMAAGIPSLLCTLALIYDVLAGLFVKGLQDFLHIYALELPFMMSLKAYLQGMAAGIPSYLCPSAPI